MGQRQAAPGTCAVSRIRSMRARLVVFADRGLAAQQVARRTEVALQEEWTRHLGRRATARLHQILTQLREITDPYR